MPGNQVRIGVGVTGAKGAASEVDKLRDKFAHLQKQGAKGFAIGAGVALTTKAFSVLDRAASAAIDFLGDSAAAFRENEVSVAQLGAALRANAPDWQKHTGAIEAAISAGQKLAFDDEDQREALTKLVGAYGSVTKALEAERLAMDLARFSGKSLAESSQLLINVHAGNYRGLRQLGISTKGVTSETQALGLIFEKVGGQATAYAETDLGKVEAANIRLEESQERFGESLSRIGADVMPLVADAADGVADAFEIAGDLTDEWNGATGRVNSHLKTTAERLAGAAAAAEDTGEEVGALTDAFEEGTDAARDLSNAVEDLADDLYGGAILAGDLADAQKDLREEQAALNAITATGSEEWTIQNGKLAEAQKKVFELQAQMAQQAGPEAFYDWLVKQEAALGDTNAEILAMIRNLKNAAAASIAAGNTPLIGGGGGIGTGKGGTGYATGGTTPGGPVWVGEQGPELVDLPAGSKVHTASESKGMTGGGPVTLNVTFTGRVGESRADIVAALQRAASFTWSSNG